METSDRCVYTFTYISPSVWRAHVCRVHMHSQIPESLLAAVQQFSIGFCLAQMVFESFDRWFISFGFGELAHLLTCERAIAAALLMRTSLLCIHTSTYVYNFFFVFSASWHCSRVANTETLGYCPRVRQIVEFENGSFGRGIKRGGVVCSPPVFLGSDENRVRGRKIEKRVKEREREERKDITGVLALLFFYCKFHPIPFSSSIDENGI